ncbi:MAG: potassium channel family protein [Lysobacterales bacterium]
MSIQTSPELAHAFVGFVTLLTVGVCVALHYEGLNLLSRQHRARRGELGRWHVLTGIFAMLVLHVVEIWIFGFAYTLLSLFPATGQIEMAVGTVNWLDRIYFSAASFSTLGYGDLIPHGPMRLLAGTEALVGLMLITWSASFTFLQMDRYWRDDA